MQALIDRKDILILKELLSDGRKSFAQIAKENNTTKDIIAYHYKQMKNKKIIVGSTIQTSCALSGHRFTANLLIRVQPPVSEKVVNLLAKKPFISVVSPLGVTPKLFAVAQVKDTDFLEQIQNSIRKLPTVLEVDTRMVTGSRSTPENLSILGINGSGNRVFTSNIPIENTDEISYIDKTDQAIADKLSACGRMAFSKIAKDLHLSTDTVARRYEKLKKNRHIKPIIQLDPTKIGYHAYAFLHISFSQNKLDYAINALMNLQDINMLQKTTGKFDVFAILMIKDIEHLTSIQEKISQLPGFADLEVEIRKMFNVWPPAKELISTF